MGFAGPRPPSSAGAKWPNACLGRARGSTWFSFGSRTTAAAGPRASRLTGWLAPAAPTALALLGPGARGRTRCARCRALRSDSCRKHDGGSALARAAPGAALLATPARRPPRGTTTAVDHRSGGWPETQPGRELGRDGFAWGRAAVRGRGRTDWTESPKASALEEPCVLRRRRDRAAWASGPGPWERPGTARGAALPDGGSAQGPPRGAAIVVVAQARDVGAKRRFRRHRRET